MKFISEERNIKEFLKKLNKEVTNGLEVYSDLIIEIGKCKGNMINTIEGETKMLVGEVRDAQAP